VFERIRSARPPRLYIAADGPRINRTEEATRCATVRKISGLVDWPCEVRTLFQEKNLGCKLGVATGITWFFDNEPEGVILEDDILPVPTFFEYCDELLERYRDDSRVSMISGCNLITAHYTATESYFFSRYNHIWGWASWRRAWRDYDVEMSDWPSWRDTAGLSKLSGGSRFFVDYWREIFDSVYRGEIDTWDYQWVFTSWRKSTLTILPAVNQTENLGFGAEATHTTSAPPDYVTASDARPLKFPLRHPALVERNVDADSIMDVRVFKIGVATGVRRLVRRIPLIGPALHRVWSAIRARKSL